MSTPFPVSDHLKIRGVVYFARMISKIRLHAAGQLPADYVVHLGLANDTTLDARFCRFWSLDYEQVKARALQNNDIAEKIFDDLFAGRQPLNTEHVLAWNLFLLKRGWRDSASTGVAVGKAASGLAHRDDIQTWSDLHDAEEGRDPQTVLG
jgi:gluconokinase